MITSREILWGLIAPAFFALYERSGVLEYWMFDPFRKGTDVWERSAGGIRSLSAAAGDILTTPLLPGLEIPLAEVFKD